MLITSTPGCYAVSLKMTGHNDYPVYPEEDGYDRFKNPYSPV